MRKQDLILNLDMQQDILLSLYLDPNIDVVRLKKSLYRVYRISELAIEVLEEEIDKEAKWWL